MKNLMITAAASALMLGMAACSQASDDIELGENTYGQTESADTVQTADTGTMGQETDRMDVESDLDQAPVDIVYLASGELSADELIGTEVLGVNGEKIATVDDLLINDRGMVQSVIFRSGDFVDLVGTKGALPFSQIDLAIDAQNEPRVSVAMTEDAIQQVAEFEQDGMNDYRLASEMIGTNAELLNTEDSARIEDIIMTKRGIVQYAVISDPMTMDESRQLGYDRITIEQGDGGAIVIDAMPEDIAMMPVFEYEASVDDSSDYGVAPASDEELETGDTVGEMTPQ